MYTLPSLSTTGEARNPLGPVVNVHAACSVITCLGLFRVVSKSCRPSRNWLERQFGQDDVTVQLRHPDRNRSSRKIVIVVGHLRCFTMHLLSASQLLYSEATK